MSDLNWIFSHEQITITQLEMTSPLFWCICIEEKFKFLHNPSFCEIHFWLDGKSKKKTLLKAKYMWKKNLGMYFKMGSPFCNLHFVFTNYIRNIIRTLLYSLTIEQILMHPFSTSASLRLALVSKIAL